MIIILRLQNIKFNALEIQIWRKKKYGKVKLEEWFISQIVKCLKFVLKFEILITYLVTKQKIKILFQRIYDIYQFISYKNAL